VPNLSPENLETWGSELIHIQSDGRKKKTKLSTYMQQKCPSSKLYEKNAFHVFNEFCLPQMCPQRSVAFPTSMFSLWLGVL
jgi:hypothetical protein